MKTVITICDTCKRDDWAARGMDKTDGERLATLIEAAAADEPLLETRRHSCLMGCERACNVAIQAAGKLTYVLGRFEVDEASASAIVEYARKHAESDSGQVPFRSWPQGVKGHFVARLPQLGGTD
ncbi:MAG: DUF1636 domain-containing protein [Paracoccaceae bacterium]|nr:DUF1636 domain-containing protein [Paracoccaceae bacterium]